MQFLMQQLNEYKQHPEGLWLDYDVKQQRFFATTKACRTLSHCRLVLAHFYLACSASYSSNLRYAFNTVLKSKIRKDLPSIINQDGFLSFFALGKPLALSEVFLILQVLEASNDKTLSNPLQLYHHPESDSYYKIVGAPPTFLSKFFRKIRLKHDAGLLQKISHDLKLLSLVQDHEQRRYLTLATLALSAVYRELEGQILLIPSFDQAETLVAYRCMQHLIDEGVKTVSLFPEHADAPGIYLCQGTELWPSQRSALGSILANFATHGSSTAAYAHSWRRIHKHLRDLRAKSTGKPWVAGHSMGGALAIQIMLYSHELIEQALAFNPPLPSQRDHEFFEQMPAHLQQKLQIHANLDDFAFWRIGERAFGQVTIWLSINRYRYYPISLIDTLLLIPAATKIILNLSRAFPAHQNLFALDVISTSMLLTTKELEIENKERTERFDYLRFFPKLYDPMRSLIRLIRRLFGWSLQQEYLQNEIEIVLLHEQDLKDSLTPTNTNEIKRELLALKRQRDQLLKELAKLRK